MNLLSIITNAPAADYASECRRNIDLAEAELERLGTLRAMDDIELSAWQRAQDKARADIAWWRHELATH